MHCETHNRQMYQMQTPEIFESMRIYKNNKDILKEQLKEKQIFENKVWSHDLLIISLNKLM